MWNVLSVKPRCLRDGSMMLVRSVTRSGLKSAAVVLYDYGVPVKQWSQPAQQNLWLEIKRASPWLS